MSSIYDRFAEYAKISEPMQKIAYPIANIIFFIIIAIFLAPIVLVIRIFNLVKYIKEYRILKKDYENYLNKK